MNELESELKKGNDVEEKLDNLIGHVRQLTKENKQMREKIDRIEDAVEGAAVTPEEKNNLRVEGMGGGPANPEIGNIMQKAKKGTDGVPVGKVEAELESSRKHALKIMRKIAQTFDNFSFKKGSGNKASRLKNQESFDDWSRKEPYDNENYSNP